MINNILTFTTLIGFAAFPHLLCYADFLDNGKENASNVWASVRYLDRFDGDNRFIERLNNIELTTFGPEIENDVVIEFIKEPTQQKALFLGISTNQKSLALLYNNRNIADKRIAQAVKLSLAKRVGSPYQDEFIAQFYSHPACSNYYVMYVEYAGLGKGLELLHTMKYINTPKTITVLLGNYIVSPDNVTAPNEGWLSLIDLKFPPFLTQVYKQRF